MKNLRWYWHSMLLLVLLLTFVSSFAMAIESLTPAPISEGDVHEKLYQLGYLPASNPKKNTAKAFRTALHAFQQDRGLEETDELDTRTLVRLFIETDETLGMYWIPVYGGKKYHGDEGCSGMNEPELASLQTALELGYQPCKRCKPGP